MAAEKQEVAWGAFAGGVALGSTQHRQIENANQLLLQLSKLYVILRV
jgi:hypothetical protein